VNAISAKVFTGLSFLGGDGGRRGERGDFRIDDPHWGYRDSPDPARRPFGCGTSPMMIAVVRKKNAVMST
jgi:hypothetical protein